MKCRWGIVRGLIKGFKSNEKLFLTIVTISSIVIIYRTYVLEKTGARLVYKSYGICIKEGVGMKLLLVEDESKMLDALSYLLKKVGYVVDAAADGKQGLQMASAGGYDIIILDRMLPFFDGLYILKEIRKWGFDTPVLLLTGKDAPADRVEGLNAGADDYLVKPFFAEELLARLRALTRRNGKGLVGDAIEAAGLILDPSRSIVTKGAETFQLTVKESALLELLMVNFGQVVTRECIMAKVWGYNSDVDVASIDVYIHFLRKKMNMANIITIRGIGYCLRENQKTL